MWIKREADHCSAAREVLSVLSFFGLDGLPGEGLDFKNLSLSLLKTF